LKTITVVLLCAVAVCETGVEPVGFVRAAPERIAFEPHEGLVVDKRFERTSSRTIEQVIARQGGEETSAEPDRRYEGTRTIVIRDTYKSDASESPFEVERFFEELSDRVTDVETDRSIELTSALEGLTVLFSCDRRTSKVTASLIDEDGVSGRAEELLDGLTPIVDLMSFLPGNEVAVGDTWDVPFEHFKWDALKPGGYVEWEEDPPNRVAQWVQQQVWNEYDGGIVAEYARREETDEGAFAVIAFEGTIRSTVELDVPRDRRAPTHVELEHEVEGTVEWSLARGLPRALRMTTRGHALERFEIEDTETGESATIEYRILDESEQVFEFD
jgi:hypothetical protein